MEDDQIKELQATPVKLTDITRGLYHAASSTYSMVANQYINLLDQYFDKTLEGAYVAKSVEVQLPDESKVNLPLISLVSPKGLMLEKVNFDFAVIADPSSIVEATTDLDGIDLTRSSIKVEMAAKTPKEGAEGDSRKQGVMDVSMEFKVIEPPEGLMRLLDKFAATVTPLSAPAQRSDLVLLSPRFFHIAQALKTNAPIARVFSQFNALEYTAEATQRFAVALKKWEDQLLAKSVEIERARGKVGDEFKKTYQYARIVFQGTEDFSRLRLSKKLSPRTRDWVNQAMEFYKTLLDDQTLSFQLSKLKNPEVGILSIDAQWQKEYNTIKDVAAKMEEYDSFRTKDSIYKENKDWLRKFTEVAKILLKEQPDKLAKLFPDSEFFNK